MNDKPAKLHLLNSEKSKSHPQVIDSLLSALDYARKNEVHYVEINIKSDQGAWYTKGSPPE